MKLGEMFDNLKMEDIIGVGELRKRGLMKSSTWRILAVLILAVVAYA